jgi:hypothetical protein
MLALRLVALALGAFRPFSQVFGSHERADRPRMGRVIPRQCYARIIADVQDASPFPCANWILRQFPGGQRPRAGQHDLHPGHARGDCRIPLFGGCVVRAVCSLWRVALLGGWRGKANGRRSVLGFRHRGCRRGRAGGDPRDVRQSRVARKGAWSIRNPSDNSVAAGILHDALASCRLGVDQTGSHELDCARPVGSCGLSLKSACCRFMLRTRHNSETR